MDTIRHIRINILCNLMIFQYNFKWKGWFQEPIMLRF